ncbi:MAG: hypothetical protein GY876_00835 [Planctomycetes bacterium]|nr:hypothetical protein [Planctomycetota bacterium]
MWKIFIILLVVVATVIAATSIGVLFRHLLMPTVRAVFKAIALLGQVVLELIRDLFAATWHIIVSILVLPAIIGALLFGRWESASRMARGLGSRFRRVGRRIGGLVTRTAPAAGMVRRTPNQPQKRKSRRSEGRFPGWKLVGSLQAGGSGAELHIAEPDIGAPPDAPPRVVIKCFDVADGSPLGHMIRESRALDGAKKLGLVIEHDHDESRFWYVMPFIPGVHLADAVKSIHTTSGPLDTTLISNAVVWARDLLSILHEYHNAGFWHKDVKPENIIINDTGAHLVDLGLVTPLQSAMTLTTHGTEYFRDPELVRQALRGAKVSEVDGARFDIYSAGAVLYYMVEGTFPAHGNLSRFDREHGDAVRWVVRRAMADYHQRYANAAEMLADVAHLASATDPRAVRPADLPSFTGEPSEIPAPPAPPVASVGDVRRRPNIEVTDWWSGAYLVRDAVPGVPQRLPDGFSNARRKKSEARQRRYEERQRRRAVRRTAVGGVFAFIVGLLVLVGTYGVLVSTRSPVNSQQHIAANLPSGTGAIVVLNDHPHGIDASEAVIQALATGGWVPREDAQLEASIRRVMPMAGTQSPDLATLLAPAFATNPNISAAIIQSPDGDPDGIEVVMVRGDQSSTHRLPPLLTKPVQSAP